MDKKMRYVEPENYIPEEIQKKYGVGKYYKGENADEPTKEVADENSEESADKNNDEITEENSDEITKENTDEIADEG